ncbi:MAG: hypothetical protein V1679_01405 [Candidatus Peregrinibacteria bacterium]
MKNLGLGRIIGLSGAALLVVGAFLPWAKIMGFLSVSGFSGDGRITLAAGVIAIILILLKKVPLWISIILGIVGLAVGGFDYYGISSAANELGAVDAENPFAALMTASIGEGLYLTILGGLGLIVGPVMAYKQRKE